MNGFGGETLSLRPLSLRPAGSGQGTGPSSNPFAAFGKGAGAGSRPRVNEDAVDVPEVPPKPRSEVIIYTAEFLQSFQEKCTRVPEGLELQKAIVMEPASISGGRPPVPTPQAPEPVVDERDWRARQAPAAGAAQAPAQVAQKPGSGSGPPSRSGSQQQLSQEGSKQAAQAQPKEARPAISQAAASVAIVKASDQGKTAWKPGSTLSDTQKAVKSVKGILNKLTPEAFDKLLEQLKSTITSTEILHGSIALVFESAVAQPTFVGMYAELCVRLSKELPEFDDTGRTRAFQRVLLNTCQEEFEGAETARQALSSSTEDRDVAARKLKLRLLGNIRLISELFKQKAVSDKIVHACIQTLMGDSKGLPSEDNVEAVCEMVTIAGKSMDEVARDRKRMDGYFSTLDKWSRSPQLQSRIRFLVRDVADLRRSKWVPRRETLKAKKIAEVRAEAHAELGMVAPPSMTTLPVALPTLQAQLANQAVPELDLFPAFKGSEAGWESLAGGKKQEEQANGGGGNSALLGDYVAPEIHVPVASSAEPSKPVRAEPEGTTPSQEPPPVKELDEEGKEKAIKSLLAEFASTYDRSEATTCVQELGEGSGELVAEASLNAIFDATSPRAAHEVCGLLVHLVKEGAVPVHSLLDLITSSAEQLEDLRLDIPKAPQLLANLHAQAIGQGAVPIGSLQQACAPVEDVELRRSYAADVLLTLQKGDGVNLESICKEGDFSVGDWLGNGAVSPSDYLKSKGVSEAVLAS